MKLLILLATLISMNAMAASQRESVKVKQITDYLSQGTFKSSVSTTYSTGEILNEKSSATTIRPELHARFSNVDTSIEVPLMWGTYSSDEESLRVIGRPTISAQTDYRNINGNQLRVGGIVKLPMQSISRTDGFDFLKLGESWHIEPKIYSTRSLGSGLSLRTSGGLAYSTDGEFKSDGVDLTLEKALVANVSGELSYRYDKKLTFGTGLHASTALADHKIKAKTPLGSGTVDDSSRDRLNVSAFGKFILNNNIITARVASALKQEDTLAGSIIGFDEQDQIGSLSASLSLTRDF